MYVYSIAERHARLVVLYERFDLKVVDVGFLNSESPQSHLLFIHNFFNNTKPFNQKQQQGGRDPRV
jgi:hypothetical protein